MLAILSSSSVVGIFVIMYETLFKINSIVNRLHRQNQPCHAVAMPPQATWDKLIVTYLLRLGGREMSPGRTVASYLEQQKEEL